MAGSVLQRLWDILKPIPPAPRREWETEPPALWTRVWEAIKPPPPIAALPATIRRRRLINTAIFSTLLLTASSFGVWRHMQSAPARAESVLRDGLRLAATGKASEALQLFDRAIDIWPKLTFAYVQRALVRQTLHQTDAAIEDLAHALKLDPGLAPAHTAMGIIFREKGDSLRAAAELTAALEIQPGEHAYFQRGQVYESLGQYRKAIEDYNAAIALLPNAPYVYRARATAKLSISDSDGASRDRSLAFAIEHSGVAGSQ